MAKRDVAWDEVEREYRAGVLTLRRIADDYGITEGAIRKRAKRDGWTRDLAKQIQERTEVKVRRALVRGGEPVRGGTQSTQKAENEAFDDDASVVEANATVLANAILGQREDIKKARSTVQRLFDELDEQMENVGPLNDLAELMRDQDGNSEALGRAFRSVVSFAGRVKSVKDLVDAQAKTFDLERRVLRIKDDTSLEDLGRAIGEGAALSASEAYKRMLDGGA